MSSRLIYWCLQERVGFHKICTCHQLKVTGGTTMGFLWSSQRDKKEAKVRSTNILVSPTNCPSWLSLHYIASHFLDPKLVKMTVGCGMSYKYKNICTERFKFSHKKTQENTVATHEGIQKYIHIYTSVLSTYAIYTAFKWISHFFRQQVFINKVERVCG
jgi:hypothetical protein